MQSLFTRTGSETITNTENLSLSYQIHHPTLQQEYRTELNTINYYDLPPNYTDLTAPPEYCSTNKNNNKNKFNLKKIRNLMNRKIKSPPPAYSAQCIPEYSPCSNARKTRKLRRNKKMTRNGVQWPFHEHARTAGLLVFG